MTTARQLRRARNHRIIMCLGPHLWVTIGPDSVDPHDHFLSVSILTWMADAFEAERGNSRAGTEMPEVRDSPWADYAEGSEKTYEGRTKEGDMCSGRPYGDHYKATPAELPQGMTLESSPTQ